MNKIQKQLPDLGLIIAEKRVSMDLSQRKLAQKIGVAPITISDIETGRRTPQGGKALKKIALFLDLNYEELLMLARFQKDALEFPLNSEIPRRLELASRLISSNIGESELDKIAKILSRAEGVY